MEVFFPINLVFGQTIWKIFGPIQFGCTNLLSNRPKISLKESALQKLFEGNRPSTNDEQFQLRIYDDTIVLFCYDNQLAVPSWFYRPALLNGITVIFNILETKALMKPVFYFILEWDLTPSQKSCKDMHHLTMHQKMQKEVLT